MSNADENIKYYIIEIICSDWNKRKSYLGKKVLMFIHVERLLTCVACAAKINVRILLKTFQDYVIIKHIVMPTIVLIRDKIP